MVSLARPIERCSLCSHPWRQVKQDHDAIPYCEFAPDWQYLGHPSPKEQGRLLAERLFRPDPTPTTKRPRRGSLRGPHSPKHGFIARTKANNRVEDVAQALTDLRPAGYGKHKGLCPFHPERTASFFVFEDSQRWHCFGCQKRGDVIDLMRHIGELDDRRYN